MRSFLYGLFAISSLIGLALVGLVFGASLKGDMSFAAHPLLSSGLTCLAIGAVGLILIPLMHVKTDS